MRILLGKREGSDYWRERTFFFPDEEHEYIEWLVTEAGDGNKMAQALLVHMSRTKLALEQLIGLVKGLLDSQGLDAAQVLEKCQDPKAP